MNPSSTDPVSPLLANRLTVSPPSAGRELRREALQADLAVIGGGLAGTCAAVAAARAGLRVVLLQDRPVLGGNASSEVRLWTLGATCHMGSNNRWAREGGVIDEILVENLHRNPEGNPLLFDTVLLEKVAEEPGIRLLLNTAVYEVVKAKDRPDHILGVTGICSQNSTIYEVTAPLFCDASGDGIVGFLSGAAFRMGAEAREAFDEGFAPDAEFGALLGHSIYFYSKDTGQPVTFVPPSFALRDIPALIPRYRNFQVSEQGCRLWWIEWGGRLDTVHDSERIKWELWRIVYGVWDYIKNSGKFPEAANLTLEWVGHIPGKRESRRFEGDYMLTQKDVVGRKLHADAVAFGGWSIDLHPADGVFAKIAGSHHLHSKGPYQIPFRCYYSRNIGNLFVAGRIISCSHIAFGSTRVMATCALGGQVAGLAAALCREWDCLPRELAAEPARVRRLQRDLMRTGHHIWGMRYEDEEDLAASAAVSASSRWQLAEFPADAPAWSTEAGAVAQMLPAPAGPFPEITLTVDVAEPMEAVFELRTTSRLDHHTPDVELARLPVQLPAGQGIEVRLAFSAVLNEARIVFVVAPRRQGLSVRTSTRMATGFLALCHRRDERTSAVGGEDFAVFLPRRRPAPQNLAFRTGAPLDVFKPESVINGVERPTHQPNAWVAAPDDAAPRLHLDWQAPQTVSRIECFFDVDFDHALESAQWAHPDRVSPYCLKRYRLLDDAGRTVHECEANHQARNVVRLAQPIRTRRLTLEALEMNAAHVPATVMGIRCYG